MLLPRELAAMERMIYLNTKVLVKIVIPVIEQSYDVYLPVNKKIGNITYLLIKSIHELSNNIYPINDIASLYNADTFEKYKSNDLLANTNIRNGSRLVLI